MSKKFNSEEMRKKTLQVRQNQEINFETAYQNAFDKVIEEAEEKIKDAMDNGKFRAYLYIWHYLPDKSDRRFTFNNIRMLDIITKGDLMSRLRDYFDSDQPHGLYVDWHKFQHQKKQSKTQYGIYVSWAERKEITHQDDDFQDELDKQTQQINTSSDFEQESKDQSPKATKSTTKATKSTTKATKSTKATESTKATNANKTTKATESTESTKASKPDKKKSK